MSKDFPCSQRGNPQKYRDQLDCYASPSRPGHSLTTQQGVVHMLSNDLTRFRKACISTTQKTLRGNTCTIASGDYSTPVSQRRSSRTYVDTYAFDVTMLTGQPQGIVPTEQRHHYLKTGCFSPRSEQRLYRCLTFKPKLSGAKRLARPHDYMTT